MAPILSSADHHSRIRQLHQARRRHSSTWSNSSEENPLASYQHFSYHPNRMSPPPRASIRHEIERPWHIQSLDFDHDQGYDDNDQDCEEYEDSLTASEYGVLQQSWIEQNHGFRRPHGQGVAHMSHQRHQPEVPAYMQSHRIQSMDSHQSIQGQQQHRHSCEVFVPQQVYIISCVHCQTHLTDRGMKAVLLLKPDIDLYSTDAMPSGTGRFPDARERLYGHAVQNPERTCQCLTQTLGCLQCGASVGYHIISPCQRCTGSASKENRSANGHRFVFHCGEVRAKERRYIVGEAGVVRAITKPPTFQPSHRPKSQTLGRDVHHDRETRTLLSSMDDLTGAAIKTDQDEAYVSINCLRNLHQYVGCSRAGERVFWHDLVQFGERVLSPNTCSFGDVLIGR